MEESHEETVITIEDDNDSEEEHSNNEHSEEETNSENENDEADVSEEDSNNEQTDVSNNNEESEDSDKCEDSDAEDTPRQASSTAETRDLHHIETEVVWEVTSQTKKGPKCEETPTTSRQTPQSNSACKKTNYKKGKGKENASGEIKRQEQYPRKSYNAHNKSGACKKGEGNVKNVSNSKDLNISSGHYKNANNSGHQNSSNQREKNNKSGNNQAWKKTNNSSSNKNNNSGNNCNNSSGNNTIRFGSSNDSTNKGKDNKNNSFNNNKNNNKNNNNNNQNNNNNNKNNNNNNSNNKNNNNNKKKSDDHPPKNILKEAKEVANSILKKRLCAQPLDSPILRFHYRLTVLFFMLLYTIIQGCWIWKESIVCVYGHNADAPVSFHIKNFCLTYSFVYDDPYDLDGKGGSQRRYLLFYRWTHQSFLILAVLFYTPRVIAKILDNPRLKQLVHDLALKEHQYDDCNWEQDTNMMHQYMNRHASTHGYLYFWLIICHMVALGIDCLVVFYFDYVLQGRFMDLMYSAYPLQREPQNFTDYLSLTFPPFVRCKLEAHILINNARVDELGCHLLLMDIYDKMFVVIWLWLAFLILCTSITILALFLWVMPPFNRLFLIMHADSQDVINLRNKIIKKYRFSDLYVLHLMKRHRSEAQFLMLMSRLVHSEEAGDLALELEKKKSKVNFKDDMTSKTDYMLELSPSTGKEQWCTKNSLLYSPILPQEEAIRTRKVDSSTPYCNCDADMSFPRNFRNREYKV